MAHPKRRRSVRVLAGSALLILLGLLVLSIVHRSGGRPKFAASTTTGRAATALSRNRHHAVRPLVLAAGPSWRLPHALQDVAAAPLPGGRVLAAGGLTAADTSSDEITLITRTGSRALSRLPAALHDAAAAAVDGAVYLFGGGNGTAQLDGILRISRAGQAASVGLLPAPSSDQSATSIGGTVYLVGGYTGSRWLDTVVAYRPRHRARVIAHLPTPIRYAAVTAAAGRIIVAGGSLPNGNAGRAVYAVDPTDGVVRRVAMLPVPTTHAAAATLGTTVFVLGGRGALVGTPSARIVAVELPRGRVRAAGRLASPLSDLAAVTTGGKILVVGGRGPSGAVDSVMELLPRRVAANARVRATRHSVDVYAADAANHLTGAARHARPLVYVPNSVSDTVDVIDPETFKIVEHFSVGALPQHVVPAWDLRMLYVTNDQGNSLTAIDPRTGRPGRTIPVDDPYNMYFTPDGRYAIVVAERLARLDFRDAYSFRLHHSLPMPCRGVDHVDFSADGSYLLASCEFSGQLVKVDVARERVLGTLALPRGAMPQDVKLAPDGSVFYVADMAAGGVQLVDGARLRIVGFIRTGAGAHGLYTSRDSRLLYVTNRNAGTVSLISFRTRQVVDTWRIPGGSPDMGNVSADGKVLWLSGRYSAEVYAISTRTGRLLARIKVGNGPHGLCVWPQPGRYSLGHTGILR